MTTREHVKAVRVVVTDPETGETLDDYVVSNSWSLITAGAVQLKSMQIWGRNTQLNVGAPKK